MHFSGVSPSHINIINKKKKKKKLEPLFLGPPQFKNKTHILEEIFSSERNGLVKILIENLYLYTIILIKHVIYKY